MAETQKNAGNGNGRTPAAAGPVAGPGAGLPEGGTDAAKERRAPESFRYEVRTPNTGFREERLGVRFYDGVGYTDDGRKAHALLELGYAYLDRKSEEYHPESNPKLVGQLFGEAAASSIETAAEKKAKASRDK